jgi:hypothetical protein
MIKKDNNNNNNNNSVLSTVRSINVIKRNGSKCKYVEIFTHRHVGSTGAPSRRTVFVRGTSAEHRELIIIIIIIIIGLIRNCTT